MLPESKICENAPQLVGTPSFLKQTAARDVLSGLTLLHRRVRRRHPEV